MGSESTIAERIRALRRRWEAITDVPEKPRSVMNVVEYGLGNQRRAEVYVNRLLRYFLDSTEPHGMDTDFLRAFLEGLPAACKFQEDLYDLSDVEVGEQVSIKKLSKHETKRQGWLDLFIQVPGEWFLIVELKFAAAESGTPFYCEADTVDGREKTEYESGGYYLYLHRADKPEASGECFVNWTWGDFIDDVVTECLAKQGARYPQRTANQLRELSYDIEQITGMSEHDKSEHEKAELFIEHYEMINDISDAFENRWDEFAGNWHRRLAERIDDGSITDEWVFWEHDDDWAYLYKTGWWRRTDTFEPVSAPVDSNRVRIGFLHRLDHHRETAIKKQTLKFQFRNCPPNEDLKAGDRNFRDTFIENFDARKDKIIATLPEAAALTGNMHNRIEAEYPIAVNEHEDFFTAYISALETAFTEHVVENPELVELLDTVYNDTLDEFR